MNNDGVDGSMVRRHGEPPHATIEVEERLVVLMSNVGEWIVFTTKGDNTGDNTGENTGERGFFPG